MATMLYNSGMKQHVVLTAVGPDRIGLADDISTHVLECECNIEESKMAVLGGEFAVILLVSGKEDAVSRLESGIEQFAGAHALNVTTRHTEPRRSPRKARPYLIETVSLDTPGIVKSVTGLLRSLGVNIEDLETETTGAPWTGAPMFHMRVRVTAPPSVHVAAFREKLEKLAFDHDLDLTITPLGA